MIAVPSGKPNSHSRDTISEALAELCAFLKACHLAANGKVADYLVRAGFAGSSSRPWSTTEILLVEPYYDLVKTLGFFLEELGFEYDVVRDAGHFRIRPSRYRCVLINIDQNNGRWRELGCASRRAYPALVCRLC